MITADGKSSPIFEPQELQVQALVMSKNGVLYAATNPDGKVYRIERAAKAKPRRRARRNLPGAPPSTSIPAPNTSGTWRSTIPATSTSPPATRVKSSGSLPTASTLSSSKATKPTFALLAIDPKGNLIAGSDGSGLVYRISPAGEGFVLYSAPKKEITALAIDNAGNIYAAGVGEKRPAGPPVIMPVTPITDAHSNALARRADNPAWSLAT